MAMRHGLGIPPTLLCAGLLTCPDSYIGAAHDPARLL